MKILILSAAAGGGHLRASYAIQSYIAAHSPGDTAEVVDALKAINVVLDKTCCGGYHFLATKTPKIFGQLYRATNEENPLYWLVDGFNHLISQRLLPLIREKNPDLILSTYPFTTEMVSKLKERGKIDIPLICLMTDYGPHRTWIAKKVDAYVVANEEMVTRMEALGVARDQIYPFGIPVNGVFFTSADKEELLKKLELTPGLSAVLIMAGSFGVNNIKKIYQSLIELPTPFQIIIITGKNKKLYADFEAMIPRSPKPVKLVSYTNEVENHMRACDLLITKPGGLTVSEALACNIPLAVFDAIPGQEEDNADFLISHNMAVPLDSGKHCAEAIRTLLEDRQKLLAMRDSCVAFDKSHANENILTLAHRLVENRIKSSPRAEK